MILPKTTKPNDLALHLNGLKTDLEGRIAEDILSLENRIRIKGNYLEALDNYGEHLNLETEAILHCYPDPKLEVVGSFINKLFAFGVAALSFYSFYQFSEGQYLKGAISTFASILGYFFTKKSFQHDQQVLAEYEQRNSWIKAVGAMYRLHYETIELSIEQKYARPKIIPIGK